MCFIRDNKKLYYIYNIEYSAKYKILNPPPGRDITSCELITDDINSKIIIKGEQTNENTG